MKVKLVVASGVHEGREIPVAGNQFMIGRDPQCQLRPASPAISKRHCLITIRGGKVFVKDVGSTNGTFIDGNQIQEEVEVHDSARLKVGPLDFKIRMEAIAPPQPAPKAAAPKAKAEDDEFAAFLLEGDAGPAATTTIPAVPDGSTITDVKTGEVVQQEQKKESKPDPKKGEGDTRSAAADILRQYQRRPRS